MTLILALTAAALGVALPRLVGGRETRTWAIWFLRRIAPGLCFGFALGLVLAYALGR
jgi:hypothetical protein